MSPQDKPDATIISGKSNGGINGLSKTSGCHHHRVYLMSPLSATKRGILDATIISGKSNGGINDLSKTVDATTTLEYPSGGTTIIQRRQESKNTIAATT
jgi:hypothetical protein